MKVVKSILFVCALFVAASCAKEPAASEEPVNTGLCISVQGSIVDMFPVDDVKSTAGSVVRVSWASGDKVFVYDGTKCLGKLNVELKDDDARYAYLENDGEIALPESGISVLTLVHVSGASTAPAIEEGKISVDISTQDKEDFPFVLYGTLDYSSGQVSISDKFVPFNFATSVMKVNCTGLESEGSVEKAVIYGMNTRCELSLSGDKAPVANGSVPGEITRTAGFSSSDQRLVFMVAVVKSDSNSSRTIKAARGGKEYAADFTAAGITPGESYNGVFVLKLVDSSIPHPFSIGKGNRVYFSKGNLCYSTITEEWSFFDHQYDMVEGFSKTLISLFCWGYGPSSIKPDTMNHGSTFIDWGEVIADGREWFTLSRDEWMYLFAKKCIEGTSYLIDDEDNEMRKNMHRVGVTVMGHPGCIVLYPDDYYGEKVSNGDVESFDTVEEYEAAVDAGIVFLPAAGYRSSASVTSSTSHLYYWARDTFSSVSAYCMELEGTSFIDGHRFKYYGLPVRLVTYSR